MQELTVIMNKTNRTPLAVCFKSQVGDIQELIKNATGIVITTHEVPFMLLGNGNMLAEAARQLDQMDASEDMASNGDPYGGGSGGVPGGFGGQF